jgi:Na+-translocating ferredoxin:NAD+ oxidoreductase RnfC subunit
VVKQGQQVSKGEKIATVADKLGAEIHSSVDGVIVEINQKAIVVERQEIS